MKGSKILGFETGRSPQTGPDGKEVILFNLNWCYHTGSRTFFLSNEVDHMLKEFEGGLVLD